MPTVSHPCRCAATTTARITAFRPGASPPPVQIAIFFSRVLCAAAMAPPCSLGLCRSDLTPSPTSGRGGGRRQGMRFAPHVLSSRRWRESSRTRAPTVSAFAPTSTGPRSCGNCRYPPRTLARSLRDLIKTGRLPMLERLRGQADPWSFCLRFPASARGPPSGCTMTWGSTASRTSGAAPKAERRGGPKRAPDRGASGGGRGVPHQGGGGAVEDDRTAALQPAGRGLASDSPHYPRRAALHRSFLQHPAGPPARGHARLGRPLLGRGPGRGPGHGHHRAAQPPCGAADRAGSRGRARTPSHRWPSAQPLPRPRGVAAR